MRFSQSGKILLVAILLAGLAASCHTLLAGPTVYVGQPATGNRSIEEFDHQQWNQLLIKYVDDQGMVDYQSWVADTNR